MRLVKIRDGLLEHDDYFKVTPFSEFLGDFQYTRSDGVFTLQSGYIERRFDYENYVIVVEKKNDILASSDELYFYVRKDYHRSGLVEDQKDSTGNSSFWKLVKYDGFIQSYISSNGKDWLHRGGGEIKKTDVQGFQVEGNTPLQLLDYKVYRNPYVTVHGFTEGYTGQVIDTNGNTVVEREFDNKESVELMIEYNLKGTIRIKDNSGVIVFETSQMDLQFGDAYSATGYQLELYYKGRLLDYKPTTLNTLDEIVMVKNASDDVYYDIDFRAIVPSTDTVTVSFDGNNYSEIANLPSIEPNQTIPLYVRIKKDKNKVNFGTRHFVLEVD